MHDGRDGIEEGELGFAGELLDGGGQRRRRERPRGDDDVVPFGRRQAGNLAAFDGDERMFVERARDVRGEMIAVDGQRAAGGQLVGVAGGHDQRAGAAHLLVQQADRVGGGIVGAEGIGADELGEAVGLVRLGAANGAHLVQHDGDAGLRDLPRRLRCRRGRRR